MLWGCMNANGVGNLIRIEGPMDSVKYVRILQENLEDSAAKIGVNEDYIFQQDNGPRHKSAFSKNYFEENGIRVMD
jgi:hypothetical protein